MEDFSLISGGGGLALEWLDIFIVFGAIVLVTLAIFFWALFRKKPGKRQRHRKHRRSYREKIKQGAGDLQKISEEHQHRHHRERRQANPSLAETGGLPPRRNKDESGSAPIA